MLKNVKSICFNKIVFTFLNEKRKLEILKYNKVLQKDININLENYKLFAGKYIIYEKDGKCKEHNFNNKLIFEYDCLNGKKIGKGKEYYIDGNLKFEGEYLNGKRHGEGKKYDVKGHIKFEGEYKNNKKWNGKRYKDENKEILYEIKDGKGIYKRHLFEGEYINGELNGKCKEYFENGNLLFEGEYKNGKKWNGKGYDLNGNIVYELNNGKGYIKQYNYRGNRLSFEGYFLNGEKNGFCKEYSGLRLTFEGEYKDGKKMEKEKNIII